MPRTLAIAAAVVIVAAGLATAAQKKLQMKDLPAAVQKTVTAETTGKGATLKGLSKEVEKGKTQYEVETMMNGKSRDLLVDPGGAVLEVEDAISIDAVPAPVKATLVAKGKVIKVETVTRGGVVSYEGVVQKGAKKSEVAVDATGKVIK